jgi:hypothetical protein
MPTVLSDSALRWTVTTLFGISIAAYAYILCVQHRRWTNAFSHLLHVTMCAAMILMAWRVGLHLPAIGPIVFFLIAVIWFVHAAGRGSSATRDRWTNCYHAVMMAAMAWMYALMDGVLPGNAGHSPHHAQSGSLIDLSAAHMPVPGHSGTISGSSWISMVNFFAILGFTIVAVYWPCRYLFVERRANPASHALQLTHLEQLSHAFVAAGTALMFGMML